MQLKFVMEKLSGKIEIAYSPEEVKQLRTQMENLGLERHTTNNLFGNRMNSSVEFYRDTSEVFRAYLSNKLRMAGNKFVDDINAPLINSEGVPNIAVYRLIPTDGKLSIPVDGFFDIAEFTQLSNTLKLVYKSMLNVITKATVTFKFIPNSE